MGWLSQRSSSPRSGKGNGNEEDPHRKQPPDGADRQNYSPRKRFAVSAQARQEALQRPGTLMSQGPISNYQLQETVNSIYAMIQEGKLAQALSLLYFMHKLNLLEWVLVKRELISSANTVKRLQLIATLLEASKKSTLAESSVLIPGLICDPRD